MLGRLLSKPMRMLGKNTLSTSLKLGALLVSSGLVAYGVKASGILNKNSSMTRYIKARAKPVAKQTAELIAPVTKSKRKGS